LDDSLNLKLERRRGMKEHIKNVVLVHGAFADGSGWEAVFNILKNDGYTVSVAQPPETSYAEDIKYTRAAIDAMDGPVVLVGHSYGGSIITEAGNHPKVAALVYIAAFALDTGESCATIEQALPQASKAFKPDGNGNWWIEPEHFAADFAADVPKDKAAFMAVSQVPISTDSFTHQATSPAWKTKPTWYMVATADRSINPDQERMMAKRANAKTVEVPAMWPTCLILRRRPSSSKRLPPLRASINRLQSRSRALLDQRVARHAEPGSPESRASADPDEIGGGPN
jgi:pimeloyl-ACP methyl ester carboxylesterase